jgi:hypothetical protein
MWGLPWLAEWLLPSQRTLPHGVSRLALIFPVVYHKENAGVDLFGVQASSTLLLWSSNQFFLNWIVFWLTDSTGLQHLRDRQQTSCLPSYPSPSLDWLKKQTKPPLPKPTLSTKSQQSSPQNVERHYNNLDTNYIANLFCKLTCRIWITPHTQVYQVQNVLQSTYWPHSSTESHS